MRHPHPASTHNGGFNGDGSVFLHALGVVRIVQRGHGDTDFAQWARETAVEAELVRYVDGAARGLLHNHLVFTAGQGVQQTLCDFLFNIQRCADLLKSNLQSAARIRLN